MQFKMCVHEVKNTSKRVIQQKNTQINSSTESIDTNPHTHYTVLEELWAHSLKLNVYNFVLRLSNFIIFIFLLVFI